MKPFLTTTSTGTTAALKASLAKLQRSQVFVGVPEAKAPRKKSKITNAQLVYIHTNGSPLRGIPARPIIEPAIEAAGNKELITGQLGKAAQAAMGSKPAEMRPHLDQAGTLGRDAAKRWFRDSRNNWAPNAPATIREKGSDRPLVDTAEMLRSITYVVEE